MTLRFRLLLLFVAGSISGFAQAPSIGAVVNELSYTTQLSPGVLASVFGSNLDGNDLVITLNGANCPVIYASATQVNIQLPWEARLGAGHVVLSHDGMSSPSFAVTISKYSPALAAFDSSGSGLGVFLSGSNLISSTNPANGGDTLTTIGEGLGATTPAIATGTVTPDPPPLYTTLVTPTMTVGSRPATVLFSGLEPGALAIDQINFTLASNTPVGTAEAVTLKIGGVSTSQITIPIGCEDNTAKVSIEEGPFNKISGGYSQQVTITNTSTTKLQAKGSLILTALSGATLANGGGSSCPSSDGSPFKSFTFTTTGSVQSATVTLKFTASNSNITYGQRVLGE